MPTLSTTSIKLPDDIKDRVQRLAEHRRRSAHWIMREAIDQYLTREEAAEQLRADALAAWDNYSRTGMHATAAEVNSWLVKLAAGEDADPPKCHP